MKRSRSDIGRENSANSTWRRGSACPTKRARDLRRMFDIEDAKAANKRKTSKD